MQLIILSEQSKSLVLLGALLKRRVLKVCLGLANEKEGADDQMIMPSCNHHAGLRHARNFQIYS